MQCVECGAEADERAAGWRAMLAADVDERGEDAEVVIYCRMCAEREFGPPRLTGPEADE
jgi:hypothetical protein